MMTKATTQQYSTWRQLRATWIFCGFGHNGDTLNCGNVNHFLYHQDNGTASQL